MPTIAAAALGGAPLPRQPQLLVAADGRTILRDPDGNALGGVRLPEVTAPVATFDPTPGARRTRTPFLAERLKTLYPTPDAYLNAVTAAAQRCEVQDIILPYRTAEYIDAAKRGPEEPQA